MNLRRLRSKIAKLAARRRPASGWSSYTSTCGYDATAEEAKKSLVRRFLGIARPGVVLDLGCNTGDYSFIAAEAGARVVAIDGDPDAVDVLFGRLSRFPATVVPAVVDLANPSPAIGHCNRERDSFLDRVEADCVLALALIHHLHVAANLPLAEIRDLFSRLTRDWLVLEFVPPDDPMFRRLLAFRVDLYGGLSLDVCRAVFRQRFDITAEEPVPGTGRTLLLLRKRK